MSTVDHAGTQAEPQVTPKLAGIILAALVVALTGYVAGGVSLGLEALFAGSVLLFYWAGVEHFKMNMLLAVVTGSLGGLANGALFVVMQPFVGEGIAAVMGLGALLFAVYCLILKWLPLLFNQAYMLMLTVTLAPPILHEAKFMEMAAAIIYSAVFWGGLVYILNLVKDRRAAKPV